jgi:hypothetical protein
METPCRCPLHPTQLSSIVMHPDFPGWLAPLAFKPSRFAEFAS